MLAHTMDRDEIMKRMELVKYLESGKRYDIKSSVGDFTATLKEYSYDRFTTVINGAVGRWKAVFTNAVGISPKDFYMNAKEIYHAKEVKS